VTRYQWLVLIIASAGWIFDAFEGQIFNLTRGPMLAEILGVPSNDSLVFQWGDRFLGIFLAGGTFGGLLFGSLGDKWGRKPVMVITILFYSIFSGMTYFATELWHVGVLRFLVAMGVGGEWAVAAALVAEVFPKHARTHAGGIFHSTSILGTWLATATAAGVGTEWRMAYLIGVVPALLTLWVRSSVSEPERWAEAKAKGEAMGSFKDMFGDARWRKRALLGMALAAVGLGTFWGVCVATKELTEVFLAGWGYDKAEATKKALFAYGFIQVAGSGVGQVCFGPLCARFGRRPAFAAMHLLSFILVPVICYLPQNYWHLLILLPIFGFASLSIHAGYAIYFPELFPNHLRATGASFCFNAGRLLAAPMLLISGELKGGVGLPLAMTILAGFFLLGLLVLCFLPETKDQPLPD
jgi:MFS family permease